MSADQNALGLRIETFTDLDNRPGWCTGSSGIYTEYSDKTKGKAFVIRHWSTISRLVTIFILVVLWCMILLLLEKENKQVGIYVVFVVTIVTFFETMFVCHHLCCSVDRKDTRLHRLWDFLLGVNTWKKMILYVLLSIPAFINPKNSPLTLGCGILINLIGIVEILQIFRERNEKKPVRYRQLGVY